jgi:Na+/proline symporter
MHVADSAYGFVIVILALTGIGIAGMRAMRGSRGRGANEYFLGGHVVTWVGLAASLFVTTLWGVWCAGIEFSFRSDVWAWSILGFVAACGLVLLGSVFSPVYRHHGAMTIPGFLSERYGTSSTGVVVSIALVLLTLFVRIPITILVGGKLLHVIFGWDPVTAALLMIVVPGVFAVAGGYAAILAIQGAAAVVAVVGLVFFGSAGGPDITLPLIADFGGGSRDWTPLLCGLIVFAMWSTCVDQSIVQRVASAGSSRDPRRAAFAAAGAIVLGGLAIGIGAATRTSDVVSTGVWSRVAAAFVGTSILTSAMATLSCHYLSVSTLSAMDLFRRYRSAADESVLVLVGRLCATLAVIVSIVASSLLALVGDAAIVSLVVAYVILGTPLAAVTIVGFLWSRRHGFGAFCGLLVGWVFGFGQAAHGPDQVVSQAGVLWLVISVFAATGVVTLGVGALGLSGPSMLRILPRRYVRVPKL